MGKVFGVRRLALERSPRGGRVIRPGLGLLKELLLPLENCARFVLTQMEHSSLHALGRSQNQPAEFSFRSRMVARRWGDRG